MDDRLFWHSVAFASSRGFPFIAAFAAARVLDVTGFGEFVAAITFLSTLVLFADLGFSIATTTRVARQSGAGHDVSRTVTVATLTSTSVGVVIAIIAAATAAPLNRLIFPGQGAAMAPFIYVAVLYVPATALASVISGAFAGLQDYRPLAGVGIVSGVVYVLLVVLLGTTMGPLAAVWGAAAGVLVRASLSLMMAVRARLARGLARPGEAFRLEASGLAHIAIPASLAAFAWMPTNSFLLALLLRSDGGRIEVAGFGAAMQIFTMVTIVPTILTQFALPRLAAEQGRAGGKALKQIAWRYCAFSTVATSLLAAAVVFSGPAILSTFGDRYRGFHDVLSALMVAAVLSAPQGILSNYLLAVSRNWVRVLSWFAWAGVVCGALILMPKHSAAAAAQAFAGGWAVLVGIQGLVVYLHRERPTSQQPVSGVAGSEARTPS